MTLTLCQNTLNLCNMFHFYLSLSRRQCWGTLLQRRYRWPFLIVFAPVSCLLARSRTRRAGARSPRPSSSKMRSEVTLCLRYLTFKTLSGNTRRTDSSQKTRKFPTIIAKIKISLTTCARFHHATGHNTHKPLPKPSGTYKNVAY